MENRSFDHMLGWMKKLNPEINGVDGSESNPINTSDPNSKRISFGDQSHFVDPDPGHSFQGIREQVFGSNHTSAATPPMNGFAQQASSLAADMPQSVMNGFQPDKEAPQQQLMIDEASPAMRRPRMNFEIHRAYVGGRMFQGFRGIRVQEVFFLNYFQDTGITVGLIGRVEKIADLLFGDRRPIDWLDFCCYCHDIGYDTHDQAELLKADLAFLECLERPNMSTKGDPQVAYVYKFMCTSVAEEYIDSLQAAAS
ncbi:hypothetical protein OROMI_007750 [Orobanche minor]